MKKRILIPGAAIGGVAVYLASQFLLFDLGNIGIPKDAEKISVEDLSPALKDEQLTTAGENVSKRAGVEVAAEKSPERLLLIDVVIDGDRFEISRVTDMVDAVPGERRQSATLEEIIAMLGKTEGDKSGTRMRISRTPEALASAETRLVEALRKAGLSMDAVDRRNRLVE